MPRSFLAVQFFTGLVLFLTGPVVSAGLPDPQKNDFGKAKLEIPIGSRWVVVKGSSGHTIITEGRAVFKEGNRVEIFWTGTYPGGFFSFRGTVEYRLDPKPDLPPAFPSVGHLDGRARMRFAGNKLVFEKPVDPWSGFMNGNHPADLFLLLKPVVK